MGEAWWIPVSENETSSAENLETIRRVKTLTGIFFGGGEPGRLMRSLYRYQGGRKTETGVMKAIRQRWMEGALVSGTSAGIEVLQDGVIIEGIETNCAFFLGYVYRW